ncbi:retropepsin-like aspartic protease family protein [Paracoccus aestuariivivens]|uniref:TIGR02281 family clan AA aspartic protease n=1 Tax=Paracoccus aestuariivivens TaxID=1820333 RepID=A0A6L6JE54_9RHOB|nr:TIGR02281 family clan AA aspartic protease [Paracoccus aestuariivivens]MTH79505.1 TIGR02281 family clan AA aspartic protease [Paracoccus aestuariivivens]
MSEDLGRLAYLVLLLIAIGGFLLVELRGQPGRTLRLAAAWAMIFLGVIAIVGIWGEIRQTVAPQARMVDNDRIEVPLGDDGHFHLIAEVNGSPIRFVVDTGATTIALGQSDARKAGIDTDSLGYVGEARTANGNVQTATVTLDTVAVGDDIHDTDVPALVLRSDLDMSLMGMSYLSRFARVSIEGNLLILER